MYLAVAAGAFLVLKSRDSGNGKTAMAKNPAFTYPQGTPLTDEQEQGVRNAVLANLGINPKEGSMQDGSKMTEQIHAQAVSGLNGILSRYFKPEIDGETYSRHSKRPNPIQRPTGPSTRRSRHGPNLRIQRSLLNSK